MKQVNNPHGNPAIVSGEVSYGKYIAKIKDDPDAYAKHLADRRNRKEQRIMKMTRKQVFEEALDAQKAQWVSEANNMLVAQVKEAKLGNTQAFNAAMAYIIGKPETQLDITSNGNTLQAPTIIFKPRELDEWKDTDNE